MAMTTIQSSPIPFPVRSSNTCAIRAWIEHWHKDHLLPLPADLKARVTWDGAWIHQNSSSQLQSNLLHWGWDKLVAKMIVETILKERKKTTGLFKALEELFRLPMGSLKRFVVKCMQGVLCAYLLHLPPPPPSDSSLSALSSRLRSFL
jgi:hypothetical protein